MPRNGSITSCHGMVPLHRATNGPIASCHEWSHYIMPRMAPLHHATNGPITSCRGMAPLHHATEWFHYIMPRMVPLHHATNGPITSCHEWSHYIMPRMVPLELLQQYSFLSPQEEYYLTHQCFLTNRALNLVVWNATEEERGLEGLNIWLQNLHVRGCLMRFSPVCHCHLMYTC